MINGKETKIISYNWYFFQSFFHLFFNFFDITVLTWFKMNVCSFLSRPTSHIDATVIIKLIITAINMLLEIYLYDR